MWNALSGDIQVSERVSGRGGVKGHV